jgi:hypothetical protein
VAKRIQKGTRITSIRMEKRFIVTAKDGISDFPPFKRQPDELPGDSIIASGGREGKDEGSARDVLGPGLPRMSRRQRTSDAEPSGLARTTM